MEKKLPDFSRAGKIAWGSFNPDLSGGTVKKHEKSGDFTANKGGGGGSEAYPSKGGGLANPIFPGANDESLIKEF